MKLIEVKSKKLATDFLECARIIYKDDHVWVCPPDNMVETVFNPAENIFFTHGEAIRWVLYSDGGEIIGRVAAFINKKKGV